jgi:hypothetical protein
MLSLGIDLSVVLCDHVQQVFILNGLVDNRVLLVREALI